MSLFLDTRGLPTVGIGICDRCKMKVPLASMRNDGNSPGLRVCDKPGCWDHFDPWRLPARKTEDITLRYPRPEVELIPQPPISIFEHIGVAADGVVFSDSALSVAPTPVVTGRANTPKAFVASYPVNLPAAAPGEVLVVAHASQSGGTSYGATGWTKLVEDGSSTALRLTILARVATGGDSCVVTGGGSLWQYARAFSIANCGSLANIYSAIAFNGAAPPDPPLCAPGVGVQSFLALAIGGHDGIHNATAAPAGFSQLYGPGPNGQEIEVLVCSAERDVVASQEDPGPVTMSSGGGLLTASATILLRG